MANKKYRVIEESKDFRVIFKPPFVLSEDISPLICHRLDYETSGLILVAKNRKTQRFYQEQFKKRQIKKEYLALVLGEFSKNEQIVEGFISRDKKKPFRFEPLISLINPKVKLEASKKIKNLNADAKDHKVYKIFGKKARWSKSVFKLLKTQKINIFKQKKYKDKNLISLIRCFPYTGRRHQIRIHLQSLGYPILGDKTYNNKLTRQANKNLRVDHLQLFNVFLSFVDLSGKEIKVRLKNDDLSCILKFS